MIGHPPIPVLKYCWLFITPLICGVSPHTSGLWVFYQLPLILVWFSQGFFSSLSVSHKLETKNRLFPVSSSLQCCTTWYIHIPSLCLVLMLAPGPRKWALWLWSPQCWWSQSSYWSHWGGWVHIIFCIIKWHKALFSKSCLNAPSLSSNHQDHNNMATPSSDLRQIRPHKPVLTLCKHVIFKAQQQHQPDRSVLGRNEKVMMEDAGRVWRYL